MKIVLDAFGGDNAPIEPIKGARLATDESDIKIILSGNKEKIIREAEKAEISLKDIEIVDAEDEILMCDEPTSILKEKKNSSMAVGLRLVADGKADAFVSAGSTGALAVGATFLGKRINKIKRTALAPILPSGKGPFMLLDSGANSECRPEHLLQFGIMGAVYMNKVHGIENPKVGLLNIGTEETKGGALQKEAYSLLREADINFVGNIEARDVMFGVCDVLVADGFSGNIFLKASEGIALYMMKTIKTKLTSSLTQKLKAVPIRKSISGIKDDFDYTKFGGAVFLGSKVPTVKVHGNATADTIKIALIQAQTIAKNQVVEEISAKIKEK